MPVPLVISATGTRKRIARRQRGMAQIWQQMPVCAVCVGWRARFFDCGGMPAGGISWFSFADDLMAVERDFVCIGFV